MKKRIAILGSTGSIGTQALSIIREYSDVFTAEVLTAQSNADLLIRQALEFMPNAVVIADETKYHFVKDALKDTPVKVFAGEKSLEQIVEMECIDTVLAAIVGFAGLKPTLNAVKYSKTIALANKETLVVAGDTIIREATKNKSLIIPVDSEHSAIFQCLNGEHHHHIEKLILTASGGPFHGKNKDFLSNISIDEALNHPIWNMGAKISIDSATLMNKGLEIIEARWLFDIQPEKIEVLIHPQSIIHSMVQFADGSVKAQMSLPDMRLPILYALGYPFRIENKFPRINFEKYNMLTFEKPDMNTFKNLSLAYQALEKGGNMPCIMNAANEIAVHSFLNKEIKFLDIPYVVEQCMSKSSYIANPTTEDYFSTDTESRIVAKEIIKKIK